MSSASPAARPGTNIDDAHAENSDVSASLNAVIAPTWPAPITAAFGRESAVAWLRHRQPSLATAPERRAGTVRRTMHPAEQRPCG